MFKILGNQATDTPWYPPSPSDSFSPCTSIFILFLSFALWRNSKIIQLDVFAKPAQSFLSFFVARRRSVLSVEPGRAPPR